MRRRQRAPTLTRRVRGVRGMGDSHMTVGSMQESDARCSITLFTSVVGLHVRTDFTCTPMQLAIRMRHVLSTQHDALPMARSLMS
jgi:hypothetical protein